MEIGESLAAVLAMLISLGCLVFFAWLLDRY